MYIAILLDKRGEHHRNAISGMVCRDTEVEAWEALTEGSIADDDDILEIEMYRRNNSGMMVFEGWFLMSRYRKAVRVDNKDGRE